MHIKQFSKLDCFLLSRCLTWIKKKKNIRNLSLENSSSILMELKFLV